MAAHLPFKYLLVFHNLFSSPASQPTWKAGMRLLAIFIFLVWESGHRGTSPFQVSFRLVP